MVNVISKSQMSELLFTLTGIPYFQINTSESQRAQVKENDVVGVESIKNMVLLPINPTKPVVGSLKYVPLGVWEGEGQEVIIQIT